MNRLCCLLLICCAGNLAAQSNSPSVSCQLFSVPQGRLRLSNPEPDGRMSVTIDNDRGPQLGSAQPRDLLIRPEAATNARPERSFEATSASGGLNGVTLQIYD